MASSWVRALTGAAPGKRGALPLSGSPISSARAAPCAAPCPTGRPKDKTFLCQRNPSHIPCIVTFTIFSSQTMRLSSPSSPHVGFHIYCVLHSHFTEIHLYTETGCRWSRPGCGILTDTKTATYCDLYSSSNAFLIAWVPDPAPFFVQQAKPQTFPRPLGIRTMFVSRCDTIIADNSG